MRRPLVCLAVLVALLFGSRTVHAWNAAGHMVVTKLAWDQLDAKDRQTLIQLLKDHPHWDRFFVAAGKPKNAPEAYFQFPLASPRADWPRGFPKPQTAEEKKIYEFHNG